MLLNRYHFRFVSILAAVALLSGCSSWAGFGSEETAVTEESQAQVSGSIDIRWSRDVDYRKPASSPGFSAPAVAMVNGEERIVIGGQDRRARILDTGGSEISRLTLGAPGESGGVQLDNGLVVIGDAEGWLTAIDPANSRIVWRASLSSDVSTTPVAVDGGFIVQTSANQIYRFSNDGKKVWSFGGSSAGLSMHSKPSPLVYGDMVYAVMSNADVIALKVRDGSFIWKRQLLLDTEAMVLGELKVAVASPVLIPGEHSGMDEPLLAVPVFQGEMFLISARDGSTIANRMISSKSAPLLLAGRLFVAGSNGHLYALSAASAETVWKLKLSEGELVGPVLWHDQLWLADNKGMAYRVSRDGALLGSIHLSGRIDREPVAASDGVLVRNHLGTLYMLR